MKSKAALIMIVLFPYLSIALIVLCLMGLMNFENPLVQEFMFFVPIIFILLNTLLFIGTLMIVLRMMYRSFRKYADLKKLLLHTLLIKLLHLPAYGILFFMSAAAMNPFLMILIPIFLFVAGSSMTFGGLIGLSAVQSARSAGEITLPSSILFSILQFLPGADVLSAIFLTIRLGSAEERES
ncbi:MAG: hypothetical protein Q4A78_06225 [Peptostreptococcaceae bacterium]|nr:hypothetical protein [Peptostreptococcaceae bacterium]